MCCGACMYCCAVCLVTRDAEGRVCGVCAYCCAVWLMTRDAVGRVLWCVCYCCAVCLMTRDAEGRVCGACAYCCAVCLVTERTVRVVVQSRTVDWIVDWRLCSSTTSSNLVSWQCSCCESKAAGWTASAMACLVSFSLNTTVVLMCNSVEWRS
jgi:hypothetical protein